MTQPDLTNDDKLFELWQAEEKRPFTGFDFTYFADKWIDEAPPWSYETLVCELMAGADAVLDIGTGGGEKLSAFKDLFPAKTVATESYPPNLQLARARLEPLGVEVIEFDDGLDTVLPLPDESFDLVINRHSAFNIADIARILKPGGAFLTQQVDGRNLSDLSAAFDSTQLWTYFTLDFALNLLRQTQLTVVLAEEWTGKLIFQDTGTLVYYLQAIPWTVPGFTVEKYRRHLQALQQQLEREGALTFTQRRMLIKAKKEKL